MHLSLLTDPLLRGPAWGCLFLGISSGLLGALMFVKRQNLIAETLSHTAYPGIALALCLLAALGANGPFIEEYSVLIATLGALVFSGIGLLWLHVLTRSRVRQDAALCWVLSGSMGIGTLIASRLQWLHPRLYQQVQGALYGQSATITDSQARVLGGFAALCACLAALASKELMAVHFDPQFAATQGLPKRTIERGVALLTACAVVAGIRGGGLVLTTGLMVAPVVAARTLTDRFGRLLTLSSIGGALSALGGLFVATRLEQMFNVGIPAGPVMVLIAGGLALALLFASPSSGLWVRWWRRREFRVRCVEENLLKSLLRHQGALTLQDGTQLLGISKGQVQRFVRRLMRQGLLCVKESEFALTNAGAERARYITRLHRLWELYLVHRMGVIAERVHANAEHIEHVLTPEVERRLTQLLQDPRVDPHEKVIPPL